MTVKKLLMLQGLAILGLIVGVAIPLGMPYDFNAPLCSTKEGMDAAKSGKYCQTCPGYDYWQNARLSILEIVAGGHPVIINAGIITTSPSKTGGELNFGNSISVMNSTIAHKQGEFVSLNLTTRKEAEAK